MSTSLSWTPSGSVGALYNQGYVSNSGTHSNASFGQIIDLNRERVEYRFKSLASEWSRATLNMSFADDMFDHRAYRDIIKLGPAVVPLLLRDFETDPIDPPHWFGALHALTKANPVPADELGHVAKMAAAWVAWGKSHGQ